MELCCFGSIGSVLREKGRLTEDELREVVSGVLLGLLDLHNANVIHGVVV